jgi:hypothetical protein
MLPEVKEQLAQQFLLFMDREKPKFATDKRFELNS